MMESKYIKKSISIGVILILLSGIVFVPSINANLDKLYDERKLIEITTEVSGLKGVKTHSVKLTQQEVNELGDLFETIKERLDGVETRGESVEIFNWAILKLNENGLLPKGKGVEETLSLMTGKFNINKFDKSVEKSGEQNKQSIDDNENRYCLIAGHTRFSLFASLNSIPRLILLFLLSQIRIYRGYLMIYLMGKIHDLTNYSFPLLSFIYEKRHINIFALYFGLSLFLGIALPFLLPVDIGGIITFGFSFYYDPWYGYTYTPSKGWVFTSGQNGIIKWNNTFYGHLSGDTLCVGTIGYTGIKIWLPLNTFFLGFASKVKLDTDHP
ncbi:MAG: hypothetical protein JSW60_00550 [Thermoplasmatales archaeon]|nr:MAG: hypothetical protein JSW60_00550 [Thermoplasmatales archaeon]